MLYSRNKVSKSIYSTYVKSLRRCFKFIILRALPLGYSAALSGRCRGGGILLLRAVPWAMFCCPFGALT